MGEGQPPEPLYPKTLGDRVSQPRGEGGGELEALDWAGLSTSLPPSPGLGVGEGCSVIV